VTDRVYKRTTESPNSRRRKPSNAKDFRPKRNTTDYDPLCSTTFSFVCIVTAA
jgi:hypothetical protein